MTASVEQRYDSKVDWEKETRRRDERLADRQRGKQGGRGGFVMVDRFAREQLRERLLFLRQLAVRPAEERPAEEVGFKFAFDCASWVGDLLSEADFRDGVIAHPDTMLAALAGIAPSTVRRRADFLILAGVLEGEAGSRRFAPGAWKWLTEGKRPPVDLVFRSLLEGPAAIRTGEHSAVTGEHSAVTGEYSAVTGEHSAVTPSPTWANERKEVKEVEEPKDLQTGAGGLLQELEALVPGCRGSVRVLREVERLRALGYTDEDLLTLVRPVATTARTPGLVVSVLAAITSPSARAQAHDVRNRERAKASADDCDHGYPHGTFTDDGRYGPKWRLCPECRQEMIG